MDIKAARKLVVAAWKKGKPAGVIDMMVVEALAQAIIEEFPEPTCRGEPWPAEEEHKRSAGE